MTAKRVMSLAILPLFFVVGCDDDDGITGPDPNPDIPSEGAVFLDGYADGVTFQAFADSKLDAVQIDSEETLHGSASLRVTVPGDGDPSGFFAGGAFTADAGWDLSGFTALTFWARSDRNATLNVAGLGNDNSGSSEYSVEVTDLDISGVWRKFVIPIPEPSLVSAESGLFYFAEGHEDGNPYTIWFDDIRFENLDANVVRAGIGSASVTQQVGTTVPVEDLTVTVAAGGVETTVDAMPAYFAFASSNEDVATVDANGLITIVGDGTAQITGAVGSVAATGAVSITTGVPLAEPAPTPTRDAADVISFFSDAYDDVTVDTWSAEWDVADLEETDVSGNPVKLYTNLSFAGIEFTSQTVDATAMTHFHMDIWTPDATAGGEVFKIKLVDFGADGAWSGGDDVEHEISVTAPTLRTGEWVGIDVPLTEFVNMTTREHLAQLIISGDPNTVFVDNIYLYAGGEVNAPANPAPAPAYEAADVVSLFSDVYTDVTVDTWSAEWDVADVADETIAGDAVKKYTNLTFAGVEFTSATVDASAMSHFRMDVWTPDATDGGEVLKIKLVDFGADGAWSGGDDVEDELTFDASTTPAIGTGAWFTLEIPLAEFAALTTRGHLAQLVISGDPNTVYVDNVLFYNDVNAPAAPAPTPTEAEADVISLFSDAYTDVTVDTWSAEWDAADLEDLSIGGDAVKKYSNLTFAGIEFTSETIDATGMTHLRLDFWTPDPTDDGQVFKVKLVDFGADGAWSGGDDVEHEISLDASSNPALATGGWVSFDIPLADFTGLTTTGHLAQLIISGDPNTVFIDNVYFRN